jgi:hypothetical protein
VIRAAFVPDGAEPPPEFAGRWDQLRMRATYDPTTGELTCATPGTHFGGDIRAEWHPDEAAGSKQDGGSTGPDSGARAIGESDADSSIGSRFDSDRRAAASSAPGDDQSDPDNQGGSWLDRYRPPLTSRFGVIPFTGQAWFGNGAARPVSPTGEAAPRGSRVASDPGTTDGEAAAPQNTGSTEHPTASGQGTPTLANPVERNLDEHTSSGSAAPSGAAKSVSPSGEPVGAAEKIPTDEGAGVDHGAVPPGTKGSPWPTSAQALNTTNQGVAVQLPDGQNIPDPNSPTGKLMSPIADLSAVAAEGRRIGATYRSMLNDPMGTEGAPSFLAGSLGVNVGQGGAFDYQRQGNSITQLPQYRNVANVNVGLLSQQAGLTLNETLTIAGRFARIKSSNANPNAPYGLAPETAQFITTGFNLGKSGVFGKATPP